MNLVDSEILKVVHLGLCFTVLFSTDFTMGYMQKAITSSITEEIPSYHIDGYTTLAVTYFVYGISLWLAPSIISFTGPRILFVLAAFVYALHPASFLAETIWVTYFFLSLAGIFGSLLWVSHGKYMITVSSSRTMARNIGIFWILYALAMIPGNIYAAFKLEGHSRIDKETRTSLLIVLSGIAVAAALMFSLLRSPTRRDASINLDENNLDSNFKEREAELHAVSTDGDINEESPLSALISTWKVFKTRSMLFLLVTFIYTGFQQAFGSGVLGSSIGFTKEFGTEAKSLIPISGLCYGSGEILGGLLQIFTDRFNVNCFAGGLCLTGRYRRGFAISVGYCLQGIAYSMLAAALPDMAVFGETDQAALLHSNKARIPMVLLSAGLVGLGDSILNTQIYPLIADLYPNRSAQACALYKFTKSMAMAVYFLLSSRVGLHSQSILLAVSGAASLAAFLLVDVEWWRSTKSNMASTEVTSENINNMSVIVCQKVIDEREGSI